MVARSNNHKICKSSILQFSSVGWFAGSVANLLKLVWLENFIKIPSTSNFYGIFGYEQCSKVSKVTSRTGHPLATLLKKSFSFERRRKNFYSNLIWNSNHIDSFIGWVSQFNSTWYATILRKSTNSTKGSFSDCKEERNLYLNIMLSSTWNCLQLN